MTDQYKNFRHTDADRNVYLVEHYPEMRGGVRHHPIFPLVQKSLPPRDVVTLVVTGGRKPEQQNGTNVLRGVAENTVVGAAFHAASDEVLGVQVAKRLWPQDDSKADQLYGLDVVYGRPWDPKLPPKRPVPNVIMEALAVARNAWRHEG